ncbi:BON domain-containing protein [Moraxella sp. ZJ142]|uniref:BON domain-containing protein n=1 Tax=Moraxella marmotae TaxID=3344520 RepID=UPI0035D51676
MKKILAVALCAAVFGLTACASGKADSIGADAMGRSIPEHISDSSIELTARRNLVTIPGINPSNVRVAIDSYRREVLLTGEVPSEQIKVDIGRTIESMRDVNKVFNYLTVIETPKSQSHTVHENYLRSKINARLIANRNIKSSQYKIIVRDRTAYVMGNLTTAQQDDILQAIQATPGMAMAVTLTTLVDHAPMDDASMATETYTPDEPYQGVPSMPDTPNDSGNNTGNSGYVLQEIYTPNASNAAPINTAPVFGGGN